jgi:acyl-[acyl-carrier-protein] desaturase
MIKPEPQIVSEIEEQRPPFPAGLLSRQEKDRLIERGLLGLYRWYTSRSQATRNWHPDKSFNWRALRPDHSLDLHSIIEGFFAVEQYVPDYVISMVRLLRRSYGRSHFQIRWGAEETKHADAWRNALLFLHRRTAQWIEDYGQALRNREWRLPWEDAFHMSFYTVIQERATQLNYLNTALAALGKSSRPELAGDHDPVLAEVAQTIAVDEAAHYNFFTEVARLLLYYYPTQALEALGDVVRHFAMPAMDILPNAHEFQEAIYRTHIYGHARHVSRDVLRVALENMSVAGRRALAEGVKRFRHVPDPDGNSRETAVFDVLDYSALETAVRRLFTRIEQYENEIGLGDLDPTRFVPSGLLPLPNR